MGMPIVNNLETSIKQMIIKVLIFFFLLLPTTLWAMNENAARPQRQHSFDLNETASSGAADSIIGKAVGEQEVQSKSAALDDFNDRKWGRKRIREPRQPVQNPDPSKRFKKSRLVREIDRSKPRIKGDINVQVKPARAYGDGKNLSGLTADGECETHTRNCIHWAGLDKETRNTHSKRISRRKNLLKTEAKQKASKRFKNWYNKQTTEERDTKRQQRYQLEKARNKLLPIEVQNAKKAQHALRMRDWRSVKMKSAREKIREKQKRKIRYQNEREQFNQLPKEIQDQKRAKHAEHARDSRLRNKLKSQAEHQQQTP